MNTSQVQRQHIGLVLSATPGYSETFFRSKIEGLVASGHQVILFCSKADEDFDLCPVVLLPRPHKSMFKQVFALMYVYLGLLPYVKRIVRFARLERQDGISWVNIFKRIYTHAPVFKHQLDWLHFGFGTLALGCENLASAINSKMAVSFRGFDIGVYPIKHPDCYKRLWDKVTKIHVISDDISDLVYTHGFKDQASMVKITPAIDVKQFSPHQKIRFETPLQLVTIARLHWKKGLEYTLQALTLLKQLNLKFMYTVIGEGEELEQLMFIAHRLGIYDNVVFKGRLSPKEIYKQLSLSTIYLQYSVQEGFCNAVLEAQAMGLLCIVSDAEGLSENVLDQKTGWVVTKRQPELLAQKIINIQDMTIAEKIKTSNQAIHHVQKKFTIEQQRQAFQTFYSI